MTDKEIMYANPLEWKLMVAKNTGHTKVTYDELNELVETINCQQAENQNLKGHLEQLKSRYDNAKAEIKRLSNSAKQWEDTAKDLFISKEKQQAKIDNLKMVLEAVEDHINPLPFETDYAKAIRQTKAEAIKEFAERLKATPMRFLVEYVEYYDKPSIDKMVLFIDDNDIDNLVKEMVGEDK